MKFWGYLACLAAVAGLFFQGIGTDWILDDGLHADVAAGECSGHSEDSPCPVGTAHDHCGVFCGHFFNAIPSTSVAFRMRAPDLLSFLVPRQESALEGFPPGLFIPPRVS